MAPLSVSFEADGGDSLETADWFFGDGVQATSVNPQHEFAVPGLYPVMLRACDAAGCDVAHTTIKVRQISGSGAEWEMREILVRSVEQESGEVLIEVNIAARDWGATSVAPVTLTLRADGFEQTQEAVECARATYDDYISHCWNAFFTLPTELLEQALDLTAVASSPSLAEDRFGSLSLEAGQLLP